MIFEETLAWLESNFQSKFDIQLTPQEKAILKAAWENETYDTVADNLYLSVGYIKDLASELWKYISYLFEEKVTKKNFRDLLLERSFSSTYIFPEREQSDIYHREDSKGNILIVDELIDNLYYIIHKLSQQGYKVHCVTDSNTALRTVGDNPPDVILLEVNLPEINGYQLCSTLKADEETSDIPVIFLSSSNQVSDKIKAFQVGGSDYINKSCQLEEVVVRIQAQINIQ